MSSKSNSRPVQLALTNLPPLPNVTGLTWETVNLHDKEETGAFLVQWEASKRRVEDALDQFDQVRKDIREGR